MEPVLAGGVLAVVLFCPPIPAIRAQAGQENDLVANRSFENGDRNGQRPAGWRAHTYGGRASFAWAADGRTGRRSVSIVSRDGADAAWRQTMAVRSYSTYRLSGWIRTEGVKTSTGRGALLNVHSLSGAETKAIAGTRDWTRVAVEFETGSRTSVLVNCLFGGWGLATGRALFDDVALRLVHQGDPDRPQAVVDLGKSVGPISPYIYGQFIEHLGRCIYGGIWAEMLADRKFHHPVTSRASPWKRHGGEAGRSVSMDVDRPYAGRRTVAVRVSERASHGGIVQRGLEVVAGRSYTGHVVVAGTGKLTTTLSWGESAAEQQTVALACDSRSFRSLPFRLQAGASGAAALRLVLEGPGDLWIAAASLMPADHVRGMRPDTLALLRELDAPIYRWPGGNFVSGYDWRDGIGPRDERPTRKNPAWKGIESNDFGLHEFLAFCRELGTEPLAVVNTGLGSPELSAAMVEYANGSASSKWGRRRAANGHPEPFAVRWWGVGNEMYGGWQLGHVSLERYVVRHDEHVRAMRAVDPTIKVVAVGATGAWSRGMLSECADTMDVLSEHFYKGEMQDLYAHVAQIPEAVRAKAAAHRRYHETLPSLAGRQIPIALDEWNYWYGKHLYGELGVRYYLRDALGIARGIHEMVRHRDVFVMANYAQTVNVIGCIKTSKTAACFATTGLPLALYRRQLGSEALAVSGHTAPLDVVATRREDSRTALAIVNPTKKARTLQLTVRGGRLAAAATRYEIAHPDPRAYNEPGKPAAVRIAESRVTGFDPASIQVAPASITLFVVDQAK